MNFFSITSAHQGGYVFIGVCLFVCLLAGLRKNYSTDFDGIRWKVGTQATEETFRCWWLHGSHYFRVSVGLGFGLGLRTGTAVLRMGDSCNPAFFATSAALTEVCALRCAILFVGCIAICHK